MGLRRGATSPAPSLNRQQLPFIAALLGHRTTPPAPSRHLWCHSGSLDFHKVSAASLTKFNCRTLVGLDRPTFMAVMLQKSFFLNKNKCALLEVNIDFDSQKGTFRLKKTPLLATHKMNHPEHKTTHLPLAVMVPQWQSDTRSHRCLRHLT